MQGKPPRGRPRLIWKVRTQSEETRKPERSGKNGPFMIYAIRATRHREKAAKGKTENVSELFRMMTVLRTQRS